MTHHTDAERAKFEDVASDYDEYPKSIERDAKGNYLLLTTVHGWMWWQAARRAPAEPVISEAQVLAITTAYEQGVGKGHQSHARKEAITNPYGDEWGCDSAWQMGYDEGREQAERKAALDTSQVVSDEELAKAFAGTDFGGTDHRNELHVAVLKKASGYHCGHTITTIMRELRLIGASGLPTKKGRKLISLAYHALMVGGP